MKIKQLQELFIQQYGADNKSLHCFFAPGRVNLIGEHIDYNGGWVFPAALSQGIYAVLRFRDDTVIRLRSTNVALPVSVRLDQEIRYAEQDGWGNYPKGVIRYLCENGHSLKGCDILYSGNLPNGAGLSSSAAILVLTAYMLLTVHGENNMDRTQLARLCQQVENEFMKVNCGIMDQFSVAMGKKEHAILLDCSTLVYRYVPFVLQEYSLVIMNTCKKRRLADSKYNERRTECDAALAMIAEHHPLNNLCQATREDVEQYVTEETLKRRARHVVSENARVLDAVKFLENGDMRSFGRLLTEAHMSLKNDYEVSGAELDAIVESALRFSGCIGARMTGAGFGGCAIALVEKSRLDDFCLFVAKAYTAITGLKPEFYISDIADGVKKIEE